VNVVLFTREYPPEVYGGAGVHVEYLSRELARRTHVNVRCFGRPRVNVASPDGSSEEPVVEAFGPWAALAGPERYLPVLQTLSVNLAMVVGLELADVAHSHTWYANFAGHLAKLLYSIPHVITSHSLEPLRPWKAEQLGPGGYAVSMFCERVALESADAVIAVSQAMRGDLERVYPGIDPSRICVIHNGIDPEEYRPDPNTDALDRYGIRTDRPMVLFVGRVARQKGIVHLLDAARLLDRRTQLVLVAAAPDTPEILEQTKKRCEMLRSEGADVIWIDRILPKRDVTQLLTHATVFCCPSIYEPLGIVNLEAMACETPVVATATGGIPEVVADGRTGILVPIEPRDDGTGEPKDPARFAADLAEAINELVADPKRARQMGVAGRREAVERFSWGAVAEQTISVYERARRGFRGDPSPTERTGGGR